MTRAKPNPVGFTTNLSRDSITFEAVGRETADLIVGQLVKVDCQDPASGQSALIRATIRTVEGNLVQADITYSRTTPNWATWTNRKGRFPVLPCQQDPSGDKPRCQQQQPASIFHAILTCNSCNQELEQGQVNQIPRGHQASPNLDCANCNETTSTQGPTSTEGPFKCKLQCQACEQPLGRYRIDKSEEEVYVCPNCTANQDGAKPPVLTVEATDRYLIRLAVSTVLHNVQTIVQAPHNDEDEDPRPAAQLAEFLLSQINRRKQTLLAFSERPSFGYNDVRTRMDILLEQQAYLENVYSEATGTKFNWATCPASTEPEGTRRFVDTMIETCNVGPERATLTYRKSLFTTAAPQRPTTQESVEFYLYA